METQELEVESVNVAHPRGGVNVKVLDGGELVFEMEINRAPDGQYGGHIHPMRTELQVMNADWEDGFVIGHERSEKSDDDKAGGRSGRHGHWTVWD